MTILITVLIFTSLVFSIRFSRATVSKLALHKSVSLYRAKYITKTISIALVVIHFIFLATFLGVQYSQVSIMMSSAFAVIGVSLFAQWSILSNISASLIIFFGFPYRVGDHIRVLEKGDDVDGIIDEISLFHVLIRRENELITYPNTLILQKPVIKLLDGEPTKSPAIEDKSQSV